MANNIKPFTIKFSSNEKHSVLPQFLYDVYFCGNFLLTLYRYIPVVIKCTGDDLIS